MQITCSMVFLGLAVGTSVLSCAVSAIDEQQDFSSEPFSQPRTKHVLVYDPPFSATAPTRVGSVNDTVRGGTDYSGPLLNALVPDHPGLTIEAHPTLYWYLSEPVKRPMELTLINEQAIEPMVKKTLHLPLKSGIRYYHLSDYYLQPGREYQWFIALVRDPVQRAKDIIAGGVIRRVNPSAALSARLQQATPRERPALYAEEGLWYDAMAAISGLIDTAPTDAHLRIARASLLEQVGLVAAADSDRNAVSYLSSGVSQ